MDCKLRSGTKSKMRLAQNVDSAEELVIGQENARAFTNISSDLRLKFPKRQCMGSKLLCCKLYIFSDAL